jgi:hypothetical protein
MSRYIDADKLVAWCNETSQTQSTVAGKAYVDAFLTEVLSCPTADVVEVVRCKDCKYSELRYGSKKKGEPSVGHYVCTSRNSTTVAEGYCHWGERREE